jgi:poly(3-hydroxybutyrate) depolymerase
MVDGFQIYVDPQKISVSGISSGAYMAVQLHVAYSKNIMGVGAIAGGQLIIIIVLTIIIISNQP